MLQKTILEELAVERKVLEHGGERVVVISHYILNYLQMCPPEGRLSSAVPA